MQHGLSNDETAPSFSDLTFEHNNQQHVRRPLYLMNIELDQGQSYQIQIYDDSKPEELAFDFCKVHNLDFASMNYILNNIKSLMNNEIGQSESNVGNNNNNNNNHNSQNDSSSLLSYDRFYDNFKQKMIMKNTHQGNRPSRILKTNSTKSLEIYSDHSNFNSNPTNTKIFLQNANNNNNNGNTSINLLFKTNLLSPKMSLMANEKNLFNFFSNCSKLDDIYQNNIKNGQPTSMNSYNYNVYKKGNKKRSCSSVFNNEHSHNKDISKKENVFENTNKSNPKRCIPKGNHRKTDSNLFSLKNINSYTKVNCHKRQYRNSSCDDKSFSKNKDYSVKDTNKSHNEQNINPVYERKKEKLFSTLYSNIYSKDENNKRNFKLSKETKFNNIYHIIHPLIKELALESKAITPQEFIKKGNKFFNSLPFEDKRALLNYETSSKQKFH